MIQKLILSIILLFSTASPAVIGDIPESKTNIIPLDGYYSSLEKAGYNLDDIDVTFKGEEVPVFNFNDGYFAILSSGVDQSVGDYELSIKHKGYELFEETVSVVPYEYPFEYENYYYTPGDLTASELEDINEKKESLFDALDRRTDEKLWQTPFDYPLEYIYITSDFGYKRVYPNFETQHKGTDFRAAVGTDLYPMSEGRVLWRTEENEPLYFEGNALIVDHGQGIASIYMHLDEVLVDQGEMVKPNQVIARTGNTGLSTGPHLHLDVRIGENRIDPVDLIKDFESLSQN